MDNLDDIDYEYGKKVLDHFISPRNVGRINDPDVFVKVGDPACGDYVEMFLNIDKNIIVEIKYLVHGCIGAISTSSALSELVKGKNLLEASLVTDDDVIEYLGGIPERKKHCSLLGVRGLQEAIKQYASKIIGS